ncbi:MAG TPA: MarR family transcriptional regulator [Amycolatopsis sp.]|uniref:MarR family winged helix-turn-helix transcriptional regulator n=1 Tax=Amycolatopsis sp. TaxID=37632 RepID=UPI002B49841A|nr:MarR family transcriptional regulator [Amycolatopsis sp.]HKS44885.1 MarR family transcriptional regulator [Amycolatopsis sp.]
MLHSYYLILAMLSEAPDRSMTMSEVADLTRSSPSRMSHAVAKLAAKGWVRRHRRAGNARVTVATLTDAGYAALAEVAPSHVEHVRRIIFDAIAPEQVHQLRDIFRAVLANLEGGEHSCFRSRPRE